MTNIYEIVVFKFNDGINLKEQKELMETLNKEIKKFAGFVGREYYYSEQYNRWVDFVIWTNQSSADKAAEDVMQSPVCVPIFAKMDNQSMVQSHYEKIGSSGK